MIFLLIFQSLVVFGFIVGLFLEQLTIGYFVLFGLAILILLLIIYRLKHPVSRETIRRRAARKQERVSSNRKKQFEKELKSYKKKHELDWIDEIEFFDAIFDDKE